MANLIQLNLDKDTGKIVARGNVIDVGGLPSQAFGYLYEQLVPGNPWNINHGQENDRVLVQIYDDTGEFIIPNEILIINLNNIQINFTSDMAGTAHIFFFSST